MREFRTSGSVRGAASNGRPYRELISRAEATGNSRATLPLVTSSDGREVGAQFCRSSFRLGDTRKLGAAHRRPAPKLPDPRRALRLSGRPYPLDVYSHQASFALNAASEERLRRISHRARPVRNSATGIRPTTK